jgi:hypothetical protein
MNSLVPKRGFALSELMVALLFLSIGVFAYISLQIFLLANSNRFENSLKAQKAAQVWMNTAVYSLAYGSDFKKSMLPSIPGDQLPDSLTKMDITVESYPDPTADSLLQRVVVIVQWKEKTGPKTYSVTSYVEKGGEEL